MKALVLGATGLIGSKVATLLCSRGHEVVEASRSRGVDAVTGSGLTSAVCGVDVILDCTSVTTQSAVKAVDFFEAVARNVVAAGFHAALGVCTPGGRFCGADPG